MMKMMTVTLIVFFCTYGYTDMISGKKLFDNAKCMECHNIKDFNDKTVRKAKIFTQLEDKVSACQMENNAYWFDDEVHYVAQYLNKEHYHFIEKE
ncbi:MAG: hypothetical protein Q8S36_07470 [Sulfuricurvum sp.]|nr:hypothetical protein [Sulfuricurvum sp.]